MSVPTCRHVPLFPVARLKSGAVLSAKAAQGTHIVALSSSFALCVRYSRSVRQLHHFPHLLCWKPSRLLTNSPNLIVQYHAHGELVPKLRKNTSGDST
jgi:hypothetical protein